MIINDECNLVFHIRMNMYFFKLHSRWRCMARFQAIEYRRYLEIVSKGWRYPFSENRPLYTVVSGMSCSQK